MSTLIRGDQLRPELQRDVLAAYVYRWTHENAQRIGKCPACAQRPGGNQEIVIPAGQHAATEVRKMWHDHHVKLVSDAEWLKDHAFYVTKLGRLDRRRTAAEPAYLIEART